MILLDGDLKGMILTSLLEGDRKGWIRTLLLEGTSIGKTLIRSGCGCWKIIRMQLLDIDRILLEYDPSLLEGTLLLEGLEEMDTDVDWIRRRLEGDWIRRQLRGLDSTLLMETMSIGRVGSDFVDGRVGSDVVA